MGKDFSSLTIVDMFKLVSTFSIFYKECSDFLHFNQVSRFVGLFNNEIGRWKAQILTDLATLLFLVFIFSVIAHEIWQNSLNRIENGFSLEIKKTSKNQNNKIEQLHS